jgi:hypothetical protein
LNLEFGAWNFGLGTWVLEFGAYWYVCFYCAYLIMVLLTIFMEILNIPLNDVINHLSLI